MWQSIVLFRAGAVNDIVDKYITSVAFMLKSVFHLIKTSL